MNEHAKRLLDKFGRISLQTVPQIKPPIPLLGVYNETNGDTDLLRRFTVKLGEYLPKELTTELDDFINAQTDGQYLEGRSTADFTLSVEIIEQKITNWNEGCRLDCSYLCSVRIYDPVRKYDGNLYKDWFRTEPENGDITEVSVIRAKELLGKVLNPWELVHLILRS